MKVLLFDRDNPLTRYQSRFWTIFSVRNGIFSPLDRARLENEGAEFYYFHPDQTYETLAAALMDVNPVGSDFGLSNRDQGIENIFDQLSSQFDLVLDSDDYQPVDVLNNLGKQIKEDSKYFTNRDDFENPSNLPEGCYVVGDIKNLWIHKKRDILPGNVFDVRNGPIIIDENVHISRFCHLEGPLYIGSDTLVKNCDITAPVAIGKTCKVSGEITTAVFADFSNKQHQSFLGISFVGKWVNIGTESVLSTLKVNYGEIRLSTPELFKGTKNPQNFPVGDIKFGSILSDCVKVPAGAILTTGSVIDVGTTIYDMPKVPKYMAPFSWGETGEKYELKRFQEDCRKIFARRKQEPCDNFIKMSEYLWSFND